MNIGNYVNFILNLLTPKARVNPIIEELKRNPSKYGFASPEEVDEYTAWVARNYMRNMSTDPTLGPRGDLGFRGQTPKDVLKEYPLESLRSCVYHLYESIPGSLQIVGVVGAVFAAISQDPEKAGYALIPYMVGKLWEMERGMEGRRREREMERGMEGRRREREMELALKDLTLALFMRKKDLEARLGTHNSETK